MISNIKNKTVKRRLPFAIVLLLGFLAIVSALTNNVSDDPVIEDFTFEVKGKKSVSQNVNQNFAFDFSPTSLEISSLDENQDYHAKYKLDDIQVNDKRLQISKSPQIIVAENIMSEHHNESFTINYTNSEKGLRQDFLIYDGPKNNATIKVNLTLETNLKAYQIDNFSVGLDDPTNDAVHLTYQDLIAFDAKGKILSSNMVLDDNKDGSYSIDLLVEGDDVVYPITIDPLNTSNTSYEPMVDSLYTGFAVNGSGNFNNDNFCDAIVTSYGFRRDGVQFVGKVNVFYGSGTGIDLAGPSFSIEGDTVINKAGFEGISTGGKFGFSIDVAGDVDGNGYDDVIVGAPATAMVDITGGGRDTIRPGAFYIFYSADDGSGLSKADADTVYGMQDTMFLGYVVAGLGDVNGDAYSDVAVSAPGHNSYTGAVYIYEGTSGGLNTTPIKTLLGSAPGEKYGTALDGPGDINKDNENDILIGAHNYTHVRPSGIDTAAGRMHLFFGVSSPGTISSVPAAERKGEHKNAQFGYSVSGAGNFDDDDFGFIDVLVGSNQYNPNYLTDMPDTLVGYGNGNGQGAVYVYSGNNSPNGISTDTAALILGPVDVSGFGSTVSEAGNVNGDAYVDVIIGAPFYSKGKSNEGAVYGYYGIDNGIDRKFDWCAVGELQNAFLGSSIDKFGACGAVSDTAGVILGAYGYGTVDTLLQGAAFIYKEGECGLSKYTEPEFLTFLPDTIFAEASFISADNGWACGMAGQGPGYAKVSFDYPIVGADCPSTISITTGIDSGGMFPIGINTVTFNIESDGITVDSSFIVKVVDIQSPIPTTCPATQFVQIGGDDDKAEITWDDPVFSDNHLCSGGSLMITPISGVPKNSMQFPGVYPIVYEARDSTGNLSYCTFRVVISKTSLDGKDCIFQEIPGSVTQSANVYDEANVEVPYTFSSNNALGDQNFGLSLLISLIEGTSGFNFPGWVKSALGEIGNSIDLAFVKLTFSYLPELKVTVGGYYEIREDSPLEAEINFAGDVCGIKPPDKLYGCRDDISFASSFMVDPATAFLKVKPGELEQRMGVFMRDFIFQWQIYIKVSACIGIPLCVPIKGCFKCIGHSETWDSRDLWDGHVFDPIELLDDVNADGTTGARIPIVSVCEESFSPGASIFTVIECLGGPGGASDFVEKLYATLREFGTDDSEPPVGDMDRLLFDPFFYDYPKDQFVFDPNRLPAIGNRIPELTFRFGRLTRGQDQYNEIGTLLRQLPNEMGPTFVNGNKLLTSGKERNLFSAEFDIFSLLPYVISEDKKNNLLCHGIDIGTRTIDIYKGSQIDRTNPAKCKVKTFSTGPLPGKGILPVLSLDVLDINLIIRSEFDVNYNFDPDLNVEKMTIEDNNNMPLAVNWKRPNAIPPSAGYGFELFDVDMDENIIIEIPDGQTEQFFMNNEFSANGFFAGRETKTQKFDVGINVIHFLPSIAIPVGFGPILSLGPFNLATLGTKKIRTYNNPFTIPEFEATVTLTPDDIPPTVFCKDTTVFMNEAGLAFLDAETVFDRANSYDCPSLNPGCDHQGDGTGMLNVIDVYPDTIYCYQYPETFGFLVIEDDNCNFDTCRFTVFLRDTFPPKIGCQEIEIAIGENGTYSLQPDEVIIGAFDNCMEINSTVFPNTFTCDDVGQTIEVRATITDVEGNSNFCVTTVTVIDPMPFLFDLCRQEDIIENAEDGECSAYINFVVPDIIPNITLNNLSPLNPETGEPYETGDRFPVGTTIMHYQAIDFCGNEQECSFKIVVNDFTDGPLINCAPGPSSPLSTDLWQCGAIYDALTPTVFDNCEENVITTYQISQEGKVLSTGFTDPGPFLYRLGASTIKYWVQDQPLLLITEVTQDADNVCGGALPAFDRPNGITGNDYIEITNFGPRSYDLSCLVIERTKNAGVIIDTFIVPESEGAIIPVGRTLIVSYVEEDHIDEDLTDNVFYKGNITDYESNESVTYRVYYGDNEIDQATITAEVQGGLIRTVVYDTDNPIDFAMADQCMPITIGSYNPGLPIPFNNGSALSTSLQTVLPNIDTCSINLVVEDTESPFCGELVAINNYSNTNGLTVDPAECNDLVINIASEESCIMDTVILRLGGLGTTNDEVTISLTSPEGTEVNIRTGSAVDSIILPNFYSEKSGGDWTLLVTTDKKNFTSLSLGDFELEIQCLDTFVMDNVTRFTAEGRCDTSFTWIHPYYLDNCGLGNISVDYSHPNEGDVNLPADGVLTGKGGYEIEALFPVGTTTVTYTLVDEAGNDHMCSFDVTVIDNENPVITFCPSELEPIVIDLAGGECTAAYEFFPTATDNCGIDTIYGVPASGSEFEIGVTEVTVYAVDFSGNVDSTCSFTVTVNEYVPQSGEMACNEKINLSLGGNCDAVLTADMILQGYDYRCFENYCMELFDEKDNLIFSGLLSENQHTFTEADQNKTFKVSIIDCLSGGEVFNSCWGYVLVQEKLIPELQCPDPITVRCNESIHPDQTGPALLVSCEEDATITWWDDFSSFEECADVSGTIERNWKVRDNEGNVSECTQIITILRGELESIYWPEDVSYVNPLPCTSDPKNITPEFLSNTLGKQYAIPTINGLPINQNSLCNFFVNYSDEILYGACEGDYNIHRTWKIENGCLPLSNVAPLNPEIKVQRISVRDNIPPVVEYCPDDFTISTDPWTCTATLDLPIPDKIEDACGSVSVRAKIYNGGTLEITGSIVNGNLRIKAIDVPVGNHLVRYDFFDSCNNRSRCEYYFTVVDDIKPNAIAKEYTVASLIESDEQGNQIVKVNAESINNGSWDACSDLQYYVRRMDGDPHDCDDKDFFPYGYDDKLTRAEAIAMYYDEVECRTIESLDDFALMSVMNPGIGDGYDYGPEICNLGEIQYNGDEWGEYVKFCCDDFGTGEDADGDGYANEYRVELIAFDHYGNWNVTWGWVKIEDPNPPTLVAKPYHAYCHEEVLNGQISAAIESIAADAFDTTLVYAYGICDTKYEVIQGTPYDVWYDPTCKYGSFKIPYETRGSKGSLVRNVQTVYIYYKDDFSCDDIYGWTLDEEDEWYDDVDNYDFRDNLSAECEPDVPPTLVWDAGPCELIGYTLVTDTLYFETDACRKIVNEWTVIDWCVYDAVEDYDKRDFLQAHWYEYQQIAAYWDDKGIDRSDTRRNRRDDELYCNSSEYWYNIGDIHNPDYEPTRTTYEAYAVDGKYLDFEYEIEVPNWKEGIYKWTQLIKVSDDDAPVITPFAGDVKMDTILTECGLDLTLELCATDDGDCPADRLKWELWEIDEIGGDIISESYGLKAALCAVWTNIPGTEESKVTRYYRAKAWDGCGNVDIYDFTWKIEDGKAPTPYCINLSSALMQDPDGTGELVSMVELWACDFDLGSYDNCPENELYFTFDGVAPAFGKVGTYDDIEKYEQYYTENGVLMFNVSGTWKNSAGSNMSSSGIAAVKLAYMTGDDEAYDEEVYRWLPVGHADNTCGLPTGGKVFTEDEMANGDTDGDGNVDVQMDVWDECFNVDNCSVELTLRCSDCDDATPMANVAGAIYTADQRMVSDVAVNIQSINNMVGSKSMYTKEDGQYAFTNNPMYLDYYVVARKEGDDDQGVSTLDLILIKRHILGLQILEDPYLRIAADVNYDKKISATDLIQIRKLILGIYPAFPDNESWRFVDSDQELNLETVLTEFKERRDIPDLSGNQMSENLIAVKIGDIDGDARVNAREGQLITRNNNRLALGFTDRYVRKGETVSVTFEGIEPVEVYGMQGTFTFTGAKLSGIRGMGFNLNASNYSIFDNSASVSFNNDEAVAFDGALFEMELIAQESGLISEMISIDGSIASNEIYVGNDLNVYVLELEKEEEGLSYALKQNEPNPFSDITTIGFNLARSGNATIVIHDVAGKIVKRISNNYPKGYNEVRLNKQELNVSGVLYYTLSSGDFTATKRMIVI